MKNSRLMSRVLGIALAFVLIGAMLPLGAFSISSQVAASPGTIYVPDDYATIQASVDAASPGDTIIVRDGTYTENVKISTDHLNVRSENGAGATIIQAAHPDDHVFEVTADYVSINGFTVTGAVEWPRAGIYVNGDDANISSNRILGNHCGIWMGSSSGSMVADNNLSSNNIGVYLYSSRSNTIVNNSASYNIRRGFVAVGIALSGWSNENTITGNIITSNEDNGIVVTQSNHNLIQYNIIESNGDFGVRLDYAHHTRIADNIIRDNLRGLAIVLSSNNKAENNAINNHSDIGILIWLSNDGNVISHNRVELNGHGIYLEDSSYNRIYLNDFKNNSSSVHSAESTNTWSSPEHITYNYGGNTYTSYLGNYWSDYTGSDSDGDGIGDTPYVIASDADNYPLMAPFEYYIQIIPATIGLDPDVLNLRARGGLVTVYIELPEGFDVNDIDVSTILLNGTVPALEWPYEVGDYNDNGIPDLMVKFDRRAVHEVVEVGESVEITITGEVDGIPFMGTDTIRVIGR